MYLLVEVINHTTLQLTCVSQWNSSRYQYNTGLHFNLSEPSFIAFVESFQVVGELLHGDEEKLIHSINPRAVSSKSTMFHYKFVFYFFPE